MRIVGLKFDRSEPGVWVSGVAHAALLATALFVAAGTKLPEAEEGIPVEVVTENQISEITKGETSAKEAKPEPKPRAERQAETRQERDPGEAPKDNPSPPKRPAEMKVAEEAVEAAAAPPPPPAPPSRPVIEPPEPPAPAPPRREVAKAPEPAAAPPPKREDLAKLVEKQEAEAIERARVEKAKADAEAKAEAEAKRVAEAKAAAKARAEAEAKAAAKAQAEAKAQALAEAKAKAEAEAEAKAQALAEAERQKQLAEAKARQVAEAKAKADAKTKAEAEAKAKRQAELADKFNAGDISRLLQSKEPAQSSGSTAKEVQRTASLGTATGAAQRLNPSQRDALMGLLRDQLHRCWQAPIGVQSADRPPVPSVRVRLNQDGTLAGEPAVLNNSADPLFRTVADSATRATRRCAPLRIPAQFQPYYEDWKTLTVNFDPRDMG